MWEESRIGLAQSHLEPDRTRSAPWRFIRLWKTDGEDLTAFGTPTSRLPSEDSQRHHTAHESPWPESNDHSRKATNQVVGKLW